MVCMPTGAIRSWLSEELQKKQNTPQLFAILGSEPNAYIYYRLRYFLLNTVLVFAIHALEFLLIFDFFDPAHASVLFLLRSLSLLIQSGWWGVLETLRE